MMATTLKRGKQEKMEEEKENEERVSGEEIKGIINLHYLDNFY